MAADATDDLQFLGLPPSSATALAVLPETGGLLVRPGNWRTDAGPTSGLAIVAAGDHLLLVAPTGSGKTLAAFLPILGAILSDGAGTGIRCLYIAPLKALIADVGPTSGPM